MSKLKQEPVDITNLLLREGGYPHFPEVPLTPPPKQNKFKGTYKQDKKMNDAMERCKQDRGGEFSNISLSSKVVAYKHLE